MDLVLFFKLFLIVGRIKPLNYCINTVINDEKLKEGLRNKNTNKLKLS